MNAILFINICIKNLKIWIGLSFESRLGALSDLELALRIKTKNPSLENQDFVVVAGDMLFQVSFIL